MSALEAKLEDALRRIEELEAAVGRTGALSGWEQLRPFFTGKTKLDGTGLQLLSGAAPGFTDPATIFWGSQFQTDILYHPPSSPGVYSYGQTDASLANLARYRVYALSNVRDWLLFYPLDNGSITKAAGLMSISASDNGSSAALQTVAPGGSPTMPTHLGATAVYGELSISHNAANVQVSIVGSEIMIAGAICYEAILSPAQLEADTNDYAPSGIESASWLRLSTDASRSLTGLDPRSDGSGSSGRDGKEIAITNVGAQNLVIVNASGASSAGWTFDIGANFTLGPSESALFRYDGTSAVWRCIARHN